MHIALFSPAWPLSANANGIVTYAHWLGLALQRMGHRVTIFTPHLVEADFVLDAHQVEGGLLYKISQFVLARTKPAGTDIFRYGRAIGDSIRSVHRLNPIDIIEMEESFGWCAHVQKVTGIPVVAKLHGPAFLSLVEEELRTEFASMKIEAEGNALHRVAAITSPCVHVLTETAKKYSLPRNPMTHIENPISKLEDDSKVWSQNTSIEATILFVGRFDKRKGGDIALLAFEEVLRKFPMAKFIFVGPDKGILGDDGVVQNFADYSRNNITKDSINRIEFLGTQQRTEIENLRLSAKLVFTASRWENQSYTGLEAMRQGCPLICVDSGGQAEIIKDGITGLIAAANDPSDLSEKMVYMLNNPELAGKFGAAAKNYVEDIHSPDRVAKMTLEVYEDVLS